MLHLKLAVGLDTVDMEVMSPEAMDGIEPQVYTMEIKDEKYCVFRFVTGSKDIFLALGTFSPKQQERLARSLDFAFKDLCEGTNIMTVRSMESAYLIARTVSPNNTIVTFVLSPAHLPRRTQK